MTERLGLRERKKLQTRETIANVALAMFLQRGFDSVSVAEIADAADVSKVTVFNYFPAKEDLVMHHIEDHTDEAAVIVRGRAEGVSPLDALRGHFLARLESRDPTTGLSDDESFLAFHRMLMDNPSLLLRVGRQWMNQESALAEAFAEAMGAGPDDIVPQVAANQVIGAQQALVNRNSQRMFAGQTAKKAYRAAVEDAERAFSMLANGLAGCGLADARG
ncbi:DNA-binding transcriptional regulator, AcrR family [Amycolatopsis xylanica]|uniref:DNA-binding transcriptional regulator, AcrR family n=1 Tax=Amycolatopsis xylanica TaxID=589385 RepID=A0A1H2VQK1_9PSEU|nr:TetR family transcriptional regulator [Amycolatopsis xylanica]SDW70702.1 DNA-binding transcriptional regulator, AcrR family [Amycolatopsis xylanica]